MTFLVPAFLAGLASIAIPIVIHLVNRERRQVVEFPSLMFLSKISYRSVRRQTLRHLLLLALRCLALALIVVAFARPFLGGRHALPAGPTASARETVVLIDRSYSMGYGDRWSRALDAARSAVSGLGAADRATLVFFANEAAVATEPTASRARLNAALFAATLSSEATRYAPAVKLAERILAGSNLPRKQVVLVSDFQKLGWARPEEVNLPAGTEVTTVDVTRERSGGAAGTAETADVAVTGATTTHGVLSDRSIVTVAARLTNTGKVAKTVDAKLDLNGRQSESRRVTVPASGAAQVTFSRIAVQKGVSRGTVSITHDALPADDQFNFIVSPDEALSVLVLQPSSARPNQSLYINRALSLSTRPSFRVEVKVAPAASPADLDSRSLVVLNEVPLPDGPLGAAMRQFVRDGGGLLIAPGEARSTPGADWAPLLPGAPSGVVDRSADAGGTLAWVDYTNPAFELFSAPRSGDFTTARFLRYRPITVRSDGGVLARFDDGAVALAERRVGTGRVVVWASSLDSYWTDLPLRPVFLPFIHQLARHVGRYSDARQWFTAGDVLDLSRHAELTGAAVRSGAVPLPLVVVSPSGKVTRLASGVAPPMVRLDEQGFYEIRGADAAAGSGQAVAVNVDPAEADLTHVDAQELASALVAGRGKSEQGVGTGALAPQTREEEERRQGMWWYLLAGALVLLAAEVVLANRLARASA